jgi:hypothetical protein
MSDPWSQEQVEQLRALASSGLSMAVIAMRMKRKKSVIRHRAAKLKIAIARDKNPKASSENTCLKRYR